MTTLEFIIQILEAKGEESFTKEYLIQLVKDHLPLEQLNLDMAELKGEQTQINKTYQKL